MRVLRQEKKTSRHSGQGRARRGEANVITCAVTCGGCLRLFIFALERADIPAPLLFAPPRTTGPLGPLQQRIWTLALSSRNLIIDVLFSPSLFLSLERSELVPLPAFCNAGLSSSAPIIASQWLGMCFLRHIRPVRPKYRIVDLAI